MSPASLSLLTWTLRLASLSSKMLCRHNESSDCELLRLEVDFFDALWVLNVCKVLWDSHVTDTIEVQSGVIRERLGSWSLDLAPKARRVEEYYDLEFWLSSVSSCDFYYMGEDGECNWSSMENGEARFFFSRWLQPADKCTRQVTGQFMLVVCHTNFDSVPL